jgi:hypothetical protein
MPRRDEVVYRLLDRTEMQPGSCWLWGGCRSKDGYGSIKIDGRKDYVHRVAYRLFNGVIPPGMEVHHTCTVKGCLNPDHLRALTHRDNLLADDTIPGRNARKTHCIRGHAFSTENTRIVPNGYRVSRRCIACSRRRVA